MSTTKYFVLSVKDALSPVVRQEVRSLEAAKARAEELSAEVVDTMVVIDWSGPIPLPEVWEK